jgi:hypothetical protein
MNYFLFIMMTKGMVSMEVERQPGVALVASPLLYCSLQIYFVLSVSMPPPREIAWEIIYLVSFKLRQFRRGKESWKGVHGVESGVHHAARTLGHVVPHLFHLVVLHIDFFFARASFLENLIYQKDCVCLMFERSLKLKIRKNIISCSTELKLK